MKTLLPPVHPNPHEPPTRHPQQGQRVAVAVALAPMLLLLALTLVVAGLIGVDVGLTVFVACCAWLGYELHRYQQTMADAEQAAADGQPR